MVGNNVPEGGGSVNDAALIDGCDDVVAGTGAEEVLGFRQNGNLESRQGSVVGPRRLGLSLFSNMVGGILKGFKASDKNMGQEEKPVGSLMVLTEAAQDAGSNEFAQSGACPVYIVACAGVRLFEEKLSTVDQQAVN